MSAVTGKSTAPKAASAWALTLRPLIVQESILVSSVPLTLTTSVLPTKPADALPTPALRVTVGAVLVAKLMLAPPALSVTATVKEPLPNWSTASSAKVMEPAAEAALSG